MTKKILALSNMVTDAVRNASEERIKKIGLKKGLFYIAEPKHSEELQKDLKKAKHFPGGSAANVIAGAAFLGERTGLIGTLGKDAIGELYRKDMQRLRIENHTTAKDGPSGICHTLITPDGERTFVLDFGVATDFEVSEKHFEDAHIFHTTAYELHDAEEATRKAIGIAKERGIRISFDLADPGVVKRLKDKIREAVSGAHIIFANEEEAREFTGKESAEEALEELSKHADIAIVKLGKKGSLIKSKTETHRIGIVPVEKLVNMNGAGDAYAAGFLSAYVSGKTLKEAGEQASAFAARVCECEGARVSK